MSLVILNGNTTNSVIQNADLTLTDLNDVNITAVVDGQVLKYNGTNFVNVDIDTIVGEELSEIDGGSY